MFQCLLTRETFAFLRNSFFRNFPIYFFPLGAKEKKSLFVFCLVVGQQSANTRFPSPPFPFPCKKDGIREKAPWTGRKGKGKGKKVGGGWGNPACVDGKDVETKR